MPVADSQPHTWPGATQAQPDQSLAEPPLLLGRYRVVETRGTGGFSTVYVCWDIRLQRKVAIKCMPLATVPNASASTLAEALEEARITSRLTHANIVTVHDFEVTSEYAYLIMEYVDGLTLAELMARVEDGVLTYDEGAHLIGSVASALAYAHENGVLHLDIKPSNVFVDLKGNVKLGDFGMATLASAAGWEGARGGTVGYMPPEQLCGQLVDERTDVFALATLCYQALSGISPFASATAEDSLKKIERGAKPLGRIESELAGPVSEGIGRALDPDPARRPSTIDGFADSVLPFLGDDQQGRQSIADLMAQATGETGPAEEAWQAAARVRVYERWPWLGRACERAGSAIVAALVGTRLAPIIARAVAPDAHATGLAGLAVLVLFALGVIAPSAAGLLAILILFGSLLAAGAYTPAFLLALGTGTVLAAWSRNLRRSELAGSALLAPCALATPFAGAGLCGLSLPPKSAAATSALGYVLYLLTTAATSTSSHEAFSREAFTGLFTPHTLVMALGLAMAAWVSSLARKSSHKAAAIAGQLAGFALIAIFQLVALRVENGGIWTEAQGGNVAVALVCSVLMSIAIVTLGPGPSPREDDSRELP